MCKEWVCKERYNGKWINTYFEFELHARFLAEKIITKGGYAVWLRCAN